MIKRCSLLQDLIKLPEYIIVRFTPVFNTNSPYWRIEDNYLYLLLLLARADYVTWPQRTAWSFVLHGREAKGIWWCHILCLASLALYGLLLWDMGGRSYSLYVFGTVSHRFQCLLGMKLECISLNYGQRSILYVMFTQSLMSGSSIQSNLVTASYRKCSAKGWRINTTFRKSCSKWIHNSVCFECSWLDKVFNSCSVAYSPGKGWREFC